MTPKMIEYNQLFGVVREKDKWILSEKRNRKNAPTIFILGENRWCSIEKSKDNQWLILFYKDEKDRNNLTYYKSFVRVQKGNLVFLFNIFNEVVRDANGRWTIKKKKKE